MNRKHSPILSPTEHVGNRKHCFEMLSPIEATTGTVTETIGELHVEDVLLCTDDNASAGVSCVGVVCSKPLAIEVENSLTTILTTWRQKTGKNIQDSQTYNERNVYEKYSCTFL